MGKRTGQGTDVHNSDILQQSLVDDMEVSFPEKETFMMV